MLIMDKKDTIEDRLPKEKNSPKPIVNDADYVNFARRRTRKYLAALVGTVIVCGAVGSYLKVYLEEQRLVKSYKICSTIQEKEVIRDLSLGRYSCSEIEEMYNKSFGE